MKFLTTCLVVFVVCLSILGIATAVQAQGPSRDWIPPLDREKNNIDPTPVQQPLPPPLPENTAVVTIDDALLDLETKIVQQAQRITQLERRLQLIESRWKVGPPAPTEIADEPAKAKVELIPTPVPDPDTNSPVAEFRKVTMHRGKRGTCHFCDLWIINEAPKLQAAGIVVTEMADIESGKVPVIEVIARGKSVRWIGYHTAEQIIAFME